MKKLLGNELYTLIARKCDFSEINEIRIRLNSNPFIKTYNGGFSVNSVCNKESIDRIINVATGNSRYAYEKEISDGFLEYAGGIRIGITGKGKINEKNLIAYSLITSLCIRIPHNISLKKDFFSIINNFDNTLIIGAPFSGKTTLIRALALELSKNNDIFIIDERSEISGCTDIFVDKRADIARGIPKDLLFEKIIRSMAPQIVVCDELFSDNDIIAVERIIKSGIKCLASYHSEKFEDINENLKNIFHQFITLSSKPSVGSIISIIRNNDT